MSAAFTPGPWLHSYRKGHDGMNRHEVHDADGETIATLAWYPVKVDSNTTTTNRTQNAMLIAAAPDLLAALIVERHIRQLGQAPDVHWESFRDMRRAAYAATDAAIAKALPVTTKDAEVSNG